MDTLIIETQEQADALVVDGMLKYAGHIKFNCDIEAGGSIEAGEYINDAWSLYHRGSINKAA